MGAVVIILLFIQMILGEEEKKRVVFIYELCDFSGVDFVEPLALPRAKGYNQNKKTKLK
jgi:hypothetical protein